MVLVENQLGVANASAIASTPGVSVIVAAPGDLGVSYAGDRDATEQAIATVLAAAREAGVPCGITAGPDEVVRRVEQGFRVIMTTGAEALALGRKAAGERKSNATGRSGVQEACHGVHRRGRTVRSELAVGFSCRRSCNLHLRQLPG